MRLTFVGDVESCSFVWTSHEGVDTCETVRIEVVLVEGTVNGVVELREVVIGNHPVENFEIFQVLLFILSQFFRPGQPLFSNRHSSFQSFNRVLNMHNQLFHFFGFQGSYINV
jgi:hypothetical protein